MVETLQILFFITMHTNLKVANVKNISFFQIL